MTASTANNHSGLSQSPAPIWTKDFLLFCFANLLNSIAFYCSMPVFPLLVSDSFGLTGIALGLVVGMYTISAILTRPPTGYALDTIGRRPVLFVGALFFSSMYFFYPHASSAIMIALIRFCHGALWGVTMGSINTAIIDILPASRRGEGIGYFGLTMIFGMALGPALGAFVQEHYGFTILFNLAGIITCLGFACVLFVKFPHIPKRNHPLSLSVLFEKTSFPISLTIFFMTVPYGTIMNFTASYARTIPEAQLPHFFLALAVGTAVARFMAGRIFDRSGPSRIMHGCFASLAAALIMLALSPTATLFPLAGFIYGIGFGIGVPVCQAMINALVPAQRRGSANATFMTAFDCGIFIGLLLTSALQEQFGWGGAYVSLAGAILISGLVFFVIALKQYNQHCHLVAMTSETEKCPHHQNDSVKNSL